MNTIRVVLNGVGGVACQLIRHLTPGGTIRVVGAADVAPEKIGKDIGEIAGCGPMGITVKSSLEEVCETTEADIAINLASSAEADETFRQMQTAIQHGMNVIVANSATFDLFHGEEALAAEIDALCKEHGVTYIGIGNTQSVERLLLLITEGVADIQRITFTHWADVSAFSEISNANQLGISLTQEEYRHRLETGRAAPLVKWRKDLIIAAAKRFSWTLDHVDYERQLLTDERGIIYGNISHLVGWVNGKDVIEMNWNFLLDPNQEYYDRVTVEGTPAVDCKAKFSLDRGKTATYAMIANAIPAVVAAPAGYMSSFDLPICAYQSVT